jgi:hypothetical protein
LGLFPRAIGGFQYLYIAINKFTKWPEATHVVKINMQFVVKFIKSIVCRFGSRKGSSPITGPSSPAAQDTHL